MILHEIYNFGRYIYPLTNFELWVIPHGRAGAESTLWSTTSMSYRISNLLKCHINVPGRHNVSKNQQRNFDGQKAIHDFDREIIFCSPIQNGANIIKNTHIIVSRY